MPDDGCCPACEPLGVIWPRASVVAPANVSVNNNECIFIFSVLPVLWNLVSRAPKPAWCVLESLRRHSFNQQIRGHSRAAALIERLALCWAENKDFQLQSF